MKKTKILLGSISIIHEKWLPYSVGVIQQYVISDPFVSEHFEFKSPLYEYCNPEFYIEYLSDVEILGLTCYTWNQIYNQKLAQLFKSLNPSGTVIFGGPNVPQDLKHQENFAQENPACDLFFVGPGEKIFLEFLKSYEKGKVPTKISSTFFKKNSDFVSNTSKNIQLETQLTSDEIPDPFNSGVFDSILAKESRIKCSFESTRGCPYRCSYCDWGGTANSRVVKFEMSSVKKILDFVYSQPNIVELEILDANFGMFERDLEVVRYMKELKRKGSCSPSISYSGLVKNGSPYLREILEIIHNDLGSDQRNLKISFQTHSPEPLRWANRRNMKLEKVFSVVNQLRASNMEITSEMIIGLPGETAESWLATLQKDFDLDIRFMRSYFLNLVCNTEIYTDAYMSKAKICKKKLLFPYELKGYGYRNLFFDGNHSVKPSSGDFECVEVIYSCFSYDLEELVKIFDFWWMYHNLVNSGFLYQFLKSNAAKLSLTAFFKEIHQNLHQLPHIHMLMHRQRETIRRLFASEPETIICDVSTYLFFSRCLRHDDIYQMWLNQDKVKQELLILFENSYPELDLSNSLNVQALNYSPVKDNIEWSSAKKFFGTDAQII
jgi:tRNA A37 methylthiotransferase MiaB